MNQQRCSIASLLLAATLLTGCGFAGSADRSAQRLTFLYWAVSRADQQELHGVAVSDSGVRDIQGLPSNLPQGTHFLAAHDDLLALRITSAWPAVAPQHQLRMYRIETATGNLSLIETVVLEDLYVDKFGRQPLLEGDKLWFGREGRFLYLATGGYWDTLAIFRVDGTGRVSLMEQPIYGYGLSIAAKVSDTGAQFCATAPGSHYGTYLSCPMLDPNTGRPDDAAGFLTKLFTYPAALAFAHDERRLAIPEVFAGTPWTNPYRHLYVFLRDSEGRWSLRANELPESAASPSSAEFDVTDQYVLMGNLDGGNTLIVRIDTSGVMTDVTTSPESPDKKVQIAGIDSYNRVFVIGSSNRYRGYGQSWWRFYQFDPATEQLSLFFTGETPLDESGTWSWAITSPLPVGPLAAP